MTDELMERLARIIGELLDDSEFDPKYYARACLSEIEAAGMVIVPREPTEEMLKADIEGYDEACAGHLDMFTAEQVYRAMLAAAHKQENTDD